MNIKGTTFSYYADKLSKIPISQIGKIARDNLIEETKRRGWRRFVRAIKDVKVDKSTVRIIVNDSKKEPGGATNNEIGAMLHRGTDDHPVKPVNKKALFWKGKVIASRGLSARMKTKGFFSKGHDVSGIKATNWFRLSVDTLEKIGTYVSEFISKVQNG